MHYTLALLIASTVSAAPISVTLPIVPATVGISGLDGVTNELPAIPAVPLIKRAVGDILSSVKLLPGLLPDLSTLPVAGSVVSETAPVVAPVDAAIAPVVNVVSLPLAKRDDLTVGVAVDGLSNALALPDTDAVLAKVDSLVTPVEQEASILPLAKRLGVAIGAEDEGTVSAAATAKVGAIVGLPLAKRLSLDLDVDVDGVAVPDTDAVVSEVEGLVAPVEAELPAVPGLPALPI